MKVRHNKIKPYYIVSATIFLCWLLNFYSSAHAQILNGYESQLIEVSSSNGGTGIVGVLGMIFSAIRLYWLLTGIFLIYAALKTAIFQGNNTTQLGIFFSVKSFVAFSIINFAYSLVEPIINQGL